MIRPIKKLNESTGRDQEKFKTFLLAAMERTSPLRDSEAEFLDELGFDVDKISSSDWKKAVEISQRYSKMPSLNEKLNESIFVTIDEDKLEKEMDKKRYDCDAYLEFIQNEYGLTDGEDFQLDNTGIGFQFRSSTSKSKIDKLRKNLGE